MSGVRVVRVLEYVYNSEERYKEDFAHWAVPASGVLNARGVELRSAIITVPVDDDREDEDPVARLRADMNYLETRVFELSQKREPEMRVITAHAGEMVGHFIDRVIDYPVEFRPFLAEHNGCSVIIEPGSTVMSVRDEWSAKRHAV